MTPEQRAASGSKRWLKNLIKDVNVISAELQRDLNADPANIEGLQSGVVKLKKAMQRAGYHGLGESIQPLLISDLDRSKVAEEN